MKNFLPRIILSPTRCSEIQTAILLSPRNTWFAQYRLIQRSHQDVWRWRVFTCAQNVSNKRLHNWRQ
jgi:hypothetical protein